MSGAWSVDGRNAVSSFGSKAGISVFAETKKVLRVSTNSVFVRVVPFLSICISVVLLVRPTQNFVDKLPPRSSIGLFFR